MNYVIYNLTTGKIDSTCSCSEDNIAIQPDIMAGTHGYLASQNASDMTHWVDLSDDEPEVKEKKLLKYGPLSCVVNEVVVIDLPEDADVLIDHEDFIQVTDGTLELEFDEAGDYTVEIDMLRYQVKKVLIHVSEN